MAVIPPSQGKGIGKALLNEALNTLRKAKMKYVQLTVHESNTSALKLYESFDFKLLEFKSNYFGKGENRFIMQVKLEGIKKIVTRKRKKASKKTSGKYKVS